MKLSIIFMISFFVISLVISLIFSSYSVYTYNKVLTEKVFDNLRNILDIYSHELDNFLAEQKEKVMIIANLNLLEHNFKNIDMGSKEDLDNLNHELNEILKNNNNFEELDILNNEGIVIAATNLESIGKREFRDVEFLEGKSGAHISEVHYSDVLGKLVIDISTNVLVDETEERLGITVAVITLEELSKLTDKKIGVGETGDVYFINKDKLLITPSRFLKGESGGVLVQKVDTKNSRNCFSMKEKGVHEGHKPLTFFLDYRGEEVIGTHEHIIELDWCLLVEMSEEEALEIPQKQFVKNLIIISVIIVSILTLAGFLVGRFIDKRVKFSRRRKK